MNVRSIVSIAPSRYESVRAKKIIPTISCWMRFYRITLEFLLYKLEPVFFNIKYILIQSFLKAISNMLNKKNTISVKR